MNDVIGHVAYDVSEEGAFSVKPYSKKMARLMDEVRPLVIPRVIIPSPLSISQHQNCSDSEISCVGHTSHPEMQSSFVSVSPLSITGKKSRVWNIRSGSKVFLLHVPTLKPNQFVLAQDRPELLKLISGAKKYDRDHNYPCIFTHKSHIPYFHLLNWYNIYSKLPSCETFEVAFRDYEVQFCVRVIMVILGCSLRSHFSLRY